MMRSSTNCTYKFRLTQIMGKVWTCFFVAFSFLFLPGAQIEIESKSNLKGPLFITKDAVFFVSKEASVFIEKNGVVKKIAGEFLKDEELSKTLTNSKAQLPSKSKMLAKELGSRVQYHKVHIQWKRIPETDFFGPQGNTCIYCILGSSAQVFDGPKLQNELFLIGFILSAPDSTIYKQNLLRQDYFNWIQSRPPPKENSA